MTANEDLFDRSLRRQIRLRRFGATEAAAVLALLVVADRQITRLLRDRLASLVGRVDLRDRRWKALLKDVREARREVLAKVQDRLTVDLKHLSAAEVAAEVAMLKAVLPIEAEVAAAPLAEVWVATKAQPIAGGFLGDWIRRLAVQDQQAIQSAVQMGVAQGEPIPAIMRRVSGSKANLFRDGTLAATRRKTEALVRTAVNQVSNEAREAVWEANEDIIAALRWTSVLDGRTTPICRGRDGRLAPVGGKPLPKGALPLEPPGARPPAHWNCRSVMVAVVDGEGLLGERPYVRDVRTRKKREIDFRAEARRTGKTIQEVRREWADENIGQAPGETTYQTWLAQQPADFQNEVLGSRRAALFRSGKLSLDQFTDPATGRLLTLEELEGKI